MASTHSGVFPKVSRETHDQVRMRRSVDTSTRFFRYGGKTIADAVGAVNAPRRTAEYNGQSTLASLDPITY
jgi:hypothetical protein